MLTVLVFIQIVGEIILVRVLVFIQIGGNIILSNLYQII